MKININNIKVPPSWSSFSDIKFDKKEKRFQETGSPGEIIINDDNVILDGYISYLVYKKNNIEEIEVFKESDEKKLYVYGTHPNSSCKKEYMWRVPSKISDKFIKKVKPGSRIYCNTKFGVAPVIVKRIMWSRGDSDTSLVVNY